MRLAFLGLLAGSGICDYGLWLAWHPLPFIVTGAALVAASLLFKVGEPE